jgi:secreted trypsin-like serine protease
MKKTLLALVMVLAAACGGNQRDAVNTEAGEYEDSYNSSEIIGGTPTTDLPAVVALYGTVPDKEGGALCTATIISKTVVLTAAHCVHPSTVGENAKFVIFTAADLTDPDKRGPGLPVKEVHFNEAWDPNNLTAGHDVAVAILAKPTKIKPMKVNRAALADSLTGATARIIGYGLDDGFNQTGAGIKRHAQVALNSFDDQFVKTGSWFGTTICNGDSGGPIITKIGNVDTVVGVNSFGFIYCLGEASSTRTDANNDFISRYVK